MALWWRPCTAVDRRRRAAHNSPGRCQTDRSGPSTQVWGKQGNETMTLCLHPYIRTCPLVYALTNTSCVYNPIIAMANFLLHVINMLMKTSKTGKQFIFNIFEDFLIKATIEPLTHTAPWT